MNAFEKLRLWLGWYPKKKRIYNIEDEFSSDYACCNKTGANDKPVETMNVPVMLKNIYVLGLTKEAVIGIILALILFILSLGEGVNPFFDSYSIYLILLSVALFQFILSKASVEINGKLIRVNTVLTPLVGSTTHVIASVDSVEVRKNKASRLAYIFLFLLGMLWLFMFFLYLIEGANPKALTRSLIWVVVSFVYGYQIYTASKSMFNVQIRFLPYPSVNKMTIHTTAAEQIADLIKDILHMGRYNDNKHL